MCQIHFIQPVEHRLTQEDMRQLCILLEDAGAVNKDGYGVTNGKLVLKSGEKYVKKYNKKVIANFVNSRFVIGHNRFGTAGTIKSKNSHPFYNTRFTWVHNGHIHNYATIADKYKLKNIRVDSQIIGELLYKRVGNKIDIIDELLKILSELSGGVSVFLYDKKTDKLYYFKYGQDFSFRLIKSNTKEIMIGSTYDYNFGLIYQATKSKYKRNCFELLKYVPMGDFIPKDGILYEVKRATLEKIGEFEMSDDYTTYYKNYGYNLYGNLIDRAYYGDLTWSVDTIEKVLKKAFNSQEIAVAKVRINRKKLYKIICPQYVADILEEEMWVDTSKPLKWKDVVALAETIIYSDYRLYNYDEKDDVSTYDGEYRERYVG